MEEVLIIPVKDLESRIKECSRRIVEYGAPEYYIPQIMILTELLKEYDKRKDLSNGAGE